MPRTFFNDGQEIIYQDLNKQAQDAEVLLLDRIAYELGQRQQDFVFYDSFLVEYVSGTSVSVKAGLGVQYDSTQVAPEGTKRLLRRAANGNKSLAAADGANPRIDIVSIKATLAASLTEDRNFKSIDDVVASVSMTTEKDWEADVVVTTGTPGVSPAIPTTPTGYIKIAELAVAASTGLPSTGGITDKRTVFLPGSSKMAYASKSANYTATPMDELILMDATGGARTVTLPPAAQCPGKILGVMKSDSSANAVTADGNSAEMINGELTQVISNQYTLLQFLSISTGWVIL